MSKGLKVQIPPQTKIAITDICGLWEVIRISREDCDKSTYPWLEERFKYHFLDEMMYICCRDGNPCHGTWGLSEKAYNGKKQLFLILDDKIAYEIINVFSIRRGNFFTVSYIHHSKNW